MRTNDNLIALAVILGLIVLAITLVLFVLDTSQRKEIAQLELRVLEIEQETVITLKTIDNIIAIFESVGVISEELARRQLGMEERE